MIQSTFLSNDPSVAPLAPPMLVVEEGNDYLVEDDTTLPYKLVKNLGQGYSANVEMVQDLHTGSVYARKLFRICGSRDKRRDIFENEIKVIRRLAPHHHVIRVFATYVAKREVGLILSPVAEGGDLEAFLQDFNEARNPPARNTLILRRSFGCLASGLAFMHSQKVRHKDIKPRNILIHQGYVLFTDFGYSLDYGAGRSTTTGRPHAITRKYCAPEVSDWGPRNSKSDIFSLGCVFLEILAALDRDIILPNTDEPYHQALDYVRDAVAWRPRQPSDSVFAITNSMLEPEPEDRPTAHSIVGVFASWNSPIFCARCWAQIQSNPFSYDRITNLNPSKPGNVPQLVQESPCDGVAKSEVAIPTPCEKGPAYNETTKLETPLEARLFRSKAIYQAQPEQDGKYHCPSEGKPGCEHAPTVSKRSYDEYVDYHLGPFRCSQSSCESMQLNSFASLLAHEREVHGMHGHNTRPFLCYFKNCTRSVQGNGFPRQCNLFDHMTRVHHPLWTPTATSKEERVKMEKRPRMELMKIER